jgi:hypothetical protein
MWRQNKPFEGGDMSWMLVAGKIYHCTQCAEKIRVKYEGGAAMIQVGAVN